MTPIPPFPGPVLSPGVIDIATRPVNAAAMDADENLPRRKDDPVAVIGLQDLDPFSVEELHARIAALEAEVARCRAKIKHAVNHRAIADSLFKS